MIRDGGSVARALPSLSAQRPGIMQVCLGLSMIGGSLSAQVLLPVSSIPIHGSAGRLDCKSSRQGKQITKVISTERYPVSSMGRRVNLNNRQGSIWRSGSARDCVHVSNLLGRCSFSFAGRAFQRKELRMLRLSHRQANEQSIDRERVPE